MCSDMQEVPLPGMVPPHRPPPHAPFSPMAQEAPLAEPFAPVHQQQAPLAEAVPQEQQQLPQKIQINVVSPAAPVGPTAIPEQHKETGVQERAQDIWIGESNRTRVNVRKMPKFGCGLGGSKEVWDREEKYQYRLTSKTLEVTFSAVDMGGTVVDFKDFHVKQSETLMGEGQGWMEKTAEGKPTGNYVYQFRARPDLQLVMNKASYDGFKAQMRAWGIM